MQNIVYYSTLYVFVIIIRFFKLKRQLGDDFPKKWYLPFQGSLEIVYTASWFVIALLLNAQREWIGPVVVIYLAVFGTSAFLEMTTEKEFKPFTKTLLHGFLIAIMFAGTYISYKRIIPNIDIYGNPNKEIVKPLLDYLIIVPYTDHTLNINIGPQNMENKYLMYEMYIKACSPDSARVIAVRQIKDSSLIQPVKPRKIKSSNDINLYDAKIKVIERKYVHEIYWIVLFPLTLFISIILWDTN